MWIEMSYIVVLIFRFRNITNDEYQLWLGRQRQIWLIPIADERVDVQVKLWNPLRTRAIPERFCGGDSPRRGAMHLYLYLYLYGHHVVLDVRRHCCIHFRVLRCDG